MFGNWTPLEKTVTNRHFFEVFEKTIRVIWYMYMDLKFLCKVKGITWHLINKFYKISAISGGPKLMGTKWAKIKENGIFFNRRYQYWPIYGERIKITQIWFTYISRVKTRTSKIHGSPTWKLREKMHCLFLRLINNKTRFWFSFFHLKVQLSGL